MVKFIFWWSVLFFILPISATAESSDFPVAITEAIKFVNVKHRGIPVTIKRIQDSQHRLTDDFTKTSRKCPPFCIQPMTVSQGVTTIGELELLAIMQKKSSINNALILDSRTPKWYKAETIPMSINIPFTAYEKNGEALMELFRAKKQTNGDYDFSKAYKLILFCNGPWCDQSPRAIKYLIELGYPPEKIHYYRGGMQAWKSFGLTTIVPKATFVGN